MDVSKSAFGVRLRRFFASRTREKYWAIHRRVIAHRFRNPNAFRLWFGCYWLPEGSALDYALSSDGFEVSECSLLSRLLGPGMTVVDVGAHHGLYSMLSSKRVGPKGRVFAFEPSPRERARLEKHLLANRCRNVSVHPFALGSKTGSEDLFLVDGAEDYCNSLRPPAVAALTSKIRVEVASLDAFLEHAGIHHVDFLKLDVEGAELDVLKGAARTLGENPKPILLVEVFDLRTRAWGYKANEIVRFLYKAGYEWFRISDDETLEAVSPDLDVYDANLLAVPSGDVTNVLHTVVNQGRHFK
jgi:FkbM family methyltransferase